LVGLFNKKKEKMSWQIPTQIEQDIIAGKATYRTFQTGNGGQSILQVPPNSYAVIFGYDFSPAGGGLAAGSADFVPAGVVVTPAGIRYFETQQISFYTGTDFYPFIHHVNSECSVFPFVVDASSPEAETTTRASSVWSVDTSPIARQVYITSANDVTITHGIILNAARASANAIPVTNRTPQGLTYGGSAQAMNTQTNYGPALTPQQFMQPSTKDYQDFAFGLLPANADGQAFATPDLTNGLRDSTEFINAVFGLANAASTNYYLCLHYALYNSPIPNTQG
jgi:hypothetical protein